MDIEVTKSGEGKSVTFFADFKDLPGSPPCGTGYTEAEAVATLFIRNLDNLQRVNMDVLRVNGKLYRHPGPSR